LSKIITRNLAKLVVQLFYLVEDLSLRNVEGRLVHRLLNISKDGVIHRQCGQPKKKWQHASEQPLWSSAVCETKCKIKG